ncbi:serine-type D-Ala-D-Ala carboxypeptidase [Spirochaetia bacterium]|nr:serine-type D-Ala-D-Ala carboxypeptidase [Spirochaetia bacterium]
MMHYKTYAGKPSVRWVPFLTLLAVLGAAGFAPAQETPPGTAVAPPELDSRAAVLLDAATGAVLFNKNGDDEISPASLTKLMTIHLALQEAAAGNAALDEAVPLPRESWAINQPPRSSLMFLAAGQRVTLRELLLGLAIPSGNDAAVAVALRFAPSTEEFAALMTAEARRMGFVKTSFVEPSGISELNMTTAMEFARFCREYVRLHPETLTELLSVREFAYPKSENVAERYRDKPGTIVQTNHNTLLGTLEGVDGLKTGYIDEAGYNIALTAERGETRLIAVILGAPAGYGGIRIRDADGTKLLTWGFEQFKTLRPIVADEPEPQRVWKGKTDSVALTWGEPLVFTTYIDRGEGLRWEYEYIDPLVAPLPVNSTVGALVLYDNQGELRRIPLVTAGNVEQGGFFKRFRDSIRLFFRWIFRVRM